MPNYVLAVICSENLKKSCHVELTSPPRKYVVTFLFFTYSVFIDGSGKLWEIDAGVLHDWIKTSKHLLIKFYNFYYSNKNII